jgi:hypothetical protein
VNGVVLLEWRYLAGRISDTTRDFGFVVSLVEYKNIPLLQAGRRELIVMRQDFKTGAHQTRTYVGSLSYNVGTQTFSFTCTEAGVSATATWSLNADVYTLSLATSELTLSDVTLTPAGAMIPEGGAGTVSIGDLGGLKVGSDYYADWVRISEGAAQVGYARLDIQTITPQSVTVPDPAAKLTHHWFALAGELSGQPVWVSAWRMVNDTSLSWGLTIARGTGASWQVESYTGAGDTPDLAHPLEVLVLDWQAVPDSDPALRTGRRWSIRAGKTDPDDLINAIIDVPVGQFIKDARVLNVSSRGSQMVEAVGTAGASTVFTDALTAVFFSIGETTYSEPDPGPEETTYLVDLPLIVR